MSAVRVKRDARETGHGPTSESAGEIVENSSFARARRRFDALKGSMVSEQPVGSADPESRAPACGAYRKYLASVDPLADDVAAAFSALPAGRGRQMLETALADGIDAVPHAPPALVDLFAQIDSTPVWVDWERIDRGGSVFLRSGAVGMSVLTLACLPMMYSSPAGTKPLVATGQLLKRAPRRLAETARFMLETSRPGGLHKRADGYRITVKVRMMHAQVRRLLRASGHWNTAWGEPVNQIHMAGTNIALSVVFLRGLRRFGLRVSRSEAESLLAMWRYSSHLMGVVPDLQCSTEAEGWHIVEIVRRCEGTPDADCRALIEAVMTASYFPRLDRLAWRVPLAYDLSRDLIGDPLSDALGYPGRGRWGWLRHAARPLVATADLTLRAVPAGHTWAARRGADLWDAVIDDILGGRRPAYQPPSLLPRAMTRMEA